jgi:hypothetical protein
MATIPKWMKSCVRAKMRAGKSLKRARISCRRHNDPAVFDGYSRKNRRSRRTRRASKRSY